MRRLRPVLILAVLLLLAVGAVWWTLPTRWLPKASATTQRRVVPPKAPAWTRKPTEFRGIQLPPVSPQGDGAAEVEVAASPAQPDTGSDAYGPATLSGWIVDAAGTNVGAGQVQVDCVLRDPGSGEILERGGAGRLYLRTDRDGFFEGDVTGPAACTLVGRRRDGLLFAQSQPRELWVQPDEFLELDLVVPVKRTGGIGVSIREHPDGIQVVMVHEGTPAFEAGLAPGDVIVGVDGRSVEDYDLDSFIGEMTGPEGTDVTFTVKDDVGTLTTHTARRTFLDRSLVR